MNFLKQDKETLELKADIERSKTSQQWAETVTWAIFWLFLFGCITLTAYFKYRYGE